MSITLRVTRMEDADELLRWRNDPLSRAYSLNNQIIEFDEHLAWLTQALVNPRLFLWTALKQNSAVGQIRANLEGDDRVFLSWIVSPEFQGQGIGKGMLQQICDIAGNVLHARIKTVNIASIRIAQATGFQYKGQQPQYELWQFQPKAISDEVAVDAQQIIDEIGPRQKTLRFFK